MGMITILCVAASCILSLQCTKYEPKPEPESTTHRSIVYNGHTIKLFPTPEEQLRYARTWFSDTNKKTASLKVILDKYPQSKYVRAQAELELAYLSIGSDYRYASKEECLLAINNYKKVINDYIDLPSICAKANWYIGWIYAELLNNREEAIAYYQTIIKQYPEEKFNLVPPVPWVSLVLPQIDRKPQTVYARPTYYWASIALLEIIRISNNEHEIWTAFQKLYTDYTNSIATGYAIRELLLSSPPLSEKIIVYANTYLNRMQFAPALAREIPAILRSRKREMHLSTEKKDH